MFPAWNRELILGNETSFPALPGLMADLHNANLHWNGNETY